MFCLIAFYLIVTFMKSYKKYVKYLFICMVISLPCFSIASWEDSACRDVTQGNLSCIDVSENYKQPYCITNVYSNRESEDVDNANACIRPTLTNKFSSIRAETTTKDLIEQYCLSLFWASNEWRIYFAKSSSETDDIDWQQTFDSHQSLFLHALCSSFKDSAWNSPFLNSNALLWEAYEWDISKLLHLQQKSKWKDLCSLKDNNSLDGCDLSIYVTKIFGWIMSDLFKIKYAQVLHVNTAENFDSKEKVEDFMKWYFSISEGYNDIKKDYSKVIAILESNQKSYKDILSSIKIINNSNLANIAEKSKCSGNIRWMEYVACALHSSQWKWLSLTPSFVTLVYNELLHYRHFVSYYSYAMQVRGRETSDLDYEVKRIDFQRYSDMQVEAFKMALNNFEEFNMTYPLHIWVLMYVEKIEKFRNNSLSKVIPLFYSLSEKLQNVQEPLS